MSFITTYCHITDRNCYLNGKLVASFDPGSSDSWLKQLYKFNNVTYPKFYKMDTLSQCGYLASEFIKASNPDRFTSYADDRIAMVFANRCSSAESDIRFQNSYEVLQTPSPAMFVYTLPNIVIGEIAIANKWYGENMFAVLPKFAPDFFINYAEILFSSGSEAVLAGWLDVTEVKVNAFVILLEKNTGGIKSNIVNLTELIEEAFT
ncbi:hypothetical protein [Dyadobacter sp. CY312]|uniref:hypothetical protein n=1 Tax=Dyadobacter sp. CY312 TaxID=2907303 RepID=UPI001F22F454|nr:hypothetical protein [Dyadobacter sp. CY312]MCE7041530.1 hypothetical protein [Dyadobacter sp. CY312]